MARRGRKRSRVGRARVARSEARRWMFSIKMVVNRGLRIQLRSCLHRIGKALAEFDKELLTGGAMASARLISPRNQAAIWQCCTGAPRA